ncbi:uncharacterized protein M437DRAFT_42614 [Aureobasidium melanogenum CBS 110374]|uniref:C2H2-type domain-containing protein n=2 Tax=Aureobasidium melanogenum TaxID=46634 RepID=A0A074W1D7_AURM1|nr:uncharacterized protein M437DRAFT_42614 [Aureobasidium melanogenum CBS 110374]KEQ65369.1 hypothetical protein M437DRAFT_42614 [Aureobasidium melanogenum CBS 110374]
MAMAVDNRQQVPGLSYDHLRYPAPHFTNPWVSGPAPSHMYATSLPQPSMVSDPGAHHLVARAPSVSVSMPMHSSAMPAPTLASDQDGLSAPRPYGSTYVTSGPSSGALYAPTSAPHYAREYPNTTSYATYNQDRRSSHPSVASTSFLGNPVLAQKHRQSSLIDINRLSASNETEQRNSFSDALDASRGMVAMSQDITPRNIYGNQGSSRSSSDSYGFPSTHSAHSSISSASTYPSSYYGSVSEASYGDYSSASESVDTSSRTLPRPTGLAGGVALPPAPQSMMGQFSSKVSSSSQKKHKCKICDKRFTRPSSLQTHMYSHTGEKPFACDVEGCGRHFSVVSNLRRHRKVHKGEDSHASPDDE